MIRVDITYDDVPDKDFNVWKSSTFYCSNAHCLPNVPCSECPWSKAYGNPNLHIRKAHPTSEPPSSETENASSQNALMHMLTYHCKNSKCNSKKSNYACMFMVDGVCQFDYHCPADLENS